MDFENLTKIQNHFRSFCEEVEVLFFVENLNQSRGSFHFEKEHFEKTKIYHFLISIQHQKKLIRFSFVSSNPMFPFQRFDQNFLEDLLPFADPATYPFNSGFLLSEEEPRFLTQSEENQKKIVLERSNFFKNRFRKEWPKWDFFFRFHYDQETCFFVNSKGLKGSYEHLQENMVFSLVNPNERRQLYGTRYFLDPNGDFISNLEKESLVQSGEEKKVLIQKGRSSVLLSPFVVETLCLIVFGKALAGMNWDSKIACALPQDFELVDDPSLGIGKNAVPFDHEGTRTQKKIICRGSQLIQEVCDLKLAFKHNQTPSGNGFRYGFFGTKPFESVPATRSTYLFLSPGKVKLSDLLHSEKDFIRIERVVFPMDRFQDLSKKGSLYTLFGYQFHRGKRKSKILVQNYSRRPLITSFPETYGSLMDSRAIILSEGQYTRTGWFPYIYVPLVSWN